MSNNYMSVKRIDLVADDPIQAFPEYQGRSFLYLRAPTEPPGVLVAIRFGSTGSFNPSNSFFLKAGEIWTFKGEFVPQQSVYLCSNMLTAMCVGSDQPTI